MICLRCGYCCKNSAVIIVNDPDKGIEEDNLIFHRGGNVVCKHLNKLESGEYYCAIHDREWFGETPCASHAQIETKNSPCRMGRFILKEGSDGQMVANQRKEKQNA